MTLNAVLKRPLEVHVFEFTGEVWVAEPRDEIQAVLLATLEAGGTIDASGLASALLGERFEAAARRLLQLSASLDLLQQDRDHRRSERYALTERGHSALQREVVLVPEKGTWLAWLANDALVPNPLLHLEAVAPSTAFDERGQNNSTRKSAPRHNREPEQATAETPRTLRDVVGVPVLMPTTQRELEIRELGPTVRRFPAGGHAELTLAVPLDGPAIAHIEGVLDVDHQRRDAKDTPRLDWQLPVQSVHQHDIFEHVIEAADTGWAWDWNDCCARVHSMEHLDTADRASMRRKQISARANLSALDLGFFPTAEMKDVRLAAASQQIADAWAGWKLLMSCATQHQTDLRFEASRADARAQFLPEWEPQLMTRERLASSIGSRTRTEGPPSRLFWMLKAAEDWEL